MQSKVYKDFEVFENGDIYLIDSGRKIFLKQYAVCEKRDYRQVTVSKNGKQRQYLVHRLVAEAFIPNPENKPQVNHIDGNPSNNNANNLEWVTQSENNKHSLENLKEKFDCIFCGEKTFSKRKICKECRQKLYDKGKREEAKKLKLEKFVENVCFYTLSQRQKELYGLYVKRMNQSDIARMYGVSRQAISQEFIKMKSQIKGENQ